jgi:hypothetical protein
MQEHVAQINTYNGFISKKLPRQRVENSSSFNNYAKSLCASLGVRSGSCDPPKFGFTNSDPS